MLYYKGSVLKTIIIFSLRVILGHLSPAHLIHNVKIISESNKLATP